MRYVKAVICAYRAAIDAVHGGSFTAERAEEWCVSCERVYHREFGRGLFHGRPGAGQFTDTDANQASVRKLHVGVVLNYYAKAGMVQVQVQDQPIIPGDTLSIHGPTSGVVDLTVNALKRDHETCERAERGTWVTFACPQRVRAQDKVFVVRTVKEHEEVLIQAGVGRTHGPPRCRRRRRPA